MTHSNDLSDSNDLDNLDNSDDFNSDDSCDSTDSESDFEDRDFEDDTIELEDNKQCSITVKTQFDSYFSKIATRQCSWFCYQASDNRRNLVDLYIEGEIKEFQNLYHQCIYNASFNKKISKDREAIETLFHPNILGKHNAEMSFFKMVYNPMGKDLYSSLVYSNTAEVLATKKSFPEITEDILRQILHNMKKYDFMMANRFIMSFVIIKCSDECDVFLLVDPHISKSHLITSDNIIRYIKYSNTNEQNIVTIAFDADFYEKNNIKIPVD